MIKIWQFLNGKKTIIAGAVLTISAFLSQVIGIEWGYHPVWMEHVINTLEWIGMCFGGVGLAHKGTKLIEKKTWE